LSVNPAGVAVFRSSEFSFTPGITFAAASAKYLDEKTAKSNVRVGIDNIGWVSAFNTQNTRGVVGINLGIGFNKLQNNTQRFSAGGRTGNTSFPRALALGLSGVPHNAFNDDASNTEWLAMETGLIQYVANQDGEYIGATEDFGPNNSIYQMGEVNQSYYRDQSGHVGEYVFNFGLNVSHKFYFGLTFGLQDISNDFYEEYHENAVDYSLFSATEFRKLSHENSVYTTGWGCNLKAGVIVRPVAGLRLGAYIHTPTWMSLRNTWSQSMSAIFEREQNTKAIDGHYDYRITTPMRWGAGVAYTFGAVALVSVDYEGVNYGSTAMYEYDGSEGSFKPDNKQLQNDCRTAANIRVGAEYKISDYAVRAGYAYYQNPQKNYKATQIGSVGFGYRGRFFSMDAAYSFAPGLKENIVMYSGNPYEMSINRFHGKLILTFGFRF
jgi:hypothetical protein